MNLSQKKIIAKQIKYFFNLAIIAAGINIGIYILILLALKPPVNPPVPKEVIQNIQNSRGDVYYAGGAFKENCKYDKHITLFDIENDKINEVRDYYYHKDVKEQFNKIWPWVFVIIIVGIYLAKGLDWISYYSKDSTE